MTLASTGVLVLQVVLGVALLVSGGTKLADEKVHVDQFDRLGLPQWFRTATGGLEVVAAVALFVSVVVAPAALAGGLLGVAVLGGALVTHVSAGDDAEDMRGPGVLLALAVVVTAYHVVGVVG